MVRSNKKPPAAKPGGFFLSGSNISQPGSDPWTESFWLRAHR